VMKPIDPGVMWLVIPYSCLLRLEAIRMARLPHAGLRLPNRGQKAYIPLQQQAKKDR
jgi:hypothetical protein